MTPEIRRRLIGCLGMLGSNADGERAAAGLLASRLLKSAGITWEELLAPKPATIHRRAAQPPSWLSAVAFCCEHADRLTPWEKQFLQSISTRRALSPRQAEVLDRICLKVREV